MGDATGACETHQHKVVVVVVVVLVVVRFRQRGVVVWVGWVDGWVGEE